MKLRARTHGDAFSCIAYVNRTHPAFWEPETAIFWNKVPEWINLKPTHLRFRVYSQSVYFVKQWCHHPTCSCCRSCWASYFFMYYSLECIFVLFLYFISLYFISHAMMLVCCLIKTFHILYQAIYGCLYCSIKLLVKRNKWINKIEKKLLSLLLLYTALKFYTHAPSLLRF